MTYFYQAISGTLLACVLCISLGKIGKDYSILITLAVCCMILLLVTAYLEPILELIRRLEILGNLDDQMVSVILKSVGIGLLSDISAMVCADAGNASMGKALHILATVVILWISIPIFNAFLDLIQQILGEI